MEPITMTISLLSLGLDAGTIVHERLDRGDDAPATEVGRVPDLWDQLQNDDLGAGDRVSVTGSLTDHGPMVFGHPRDVKETHFQMRDRLTDGADVASVDPGTLDGLISMSSGNPLVRVPPERGVQYAGLYEGIGRNSLPVFVDADAYATWASGHDAAVRDATVTGTLRRVPEQWRDLVSAFGIEADEAVALFVEPDGISDAGETAFFEADIWAVYDTGGERRWVSRCPDFARRNELRKDVRTVASVADEEATELVAQFDMADEPISRRLGVQPSPSYMQESANEQVRQAYLERIRDLVGESSGV